MQITSRSFIVSSLAIALPLSAQTIAGISSLSSSCQAGAISLVTGSSGFGTCSDIVGLVSVLSATGSVITPLNTWITGLCSQTCSAAVIQNATSTIETACSTDIASGAELAIGLETLVSNYTQVKDVLCLQATSNSTYCLTNLLTAVQNSTGSTIDVSTVTSLLTGGVSALTSLAQSLPASALCTDCTHAEISKLEALANSTSTASTSTYSSALNAVSSECGAGFIDGKIPSTVSEAGSSTTSNSAVSSKPLSGVAALNVEAKMFGIVAAMVGAAGFGAWATLF